MGLPSDLRIRHATDADAPELSELLRVCLGPESAAHRPEHWTWKHRANPFGPSPCLVAEAGGRLVAARPFLRWTWLARSGPVHAVRAVDTVTHPEWRRAGIFSKLTLALLEEVRSEGCSFVFNTPNRASRAGYLAMGWEDVGPIVALVRARRPIRTLRRLAGGVVNGDGDGPARVEDRRSIEALLADEAALHCIETRRVRESSLETPRSAEYLRWRYHDVPGRAYQAEWSLEGDQGAVVIWRIRRRAGACELDLVEVTLAGGDRAVSTGARLVKKLVHETRADYAVAHAAPGTPERACLRRAGFLPLPLLRRRLTVRVLQPAPGAPDPRSRASWRLSLGDLELF